VITDARKTWGRANTLALWAIAVGTTVEMCCVWALFDRMLPASVFGEITTGFLWLLGLLGAGAQLPSAAEKMPGHRSYDPGAPGRVTTPEEVAP
jgi:hypothetical protein